MSTSGYDALHSHTEANNHDEPPASHNKPPTSIETEEVDLSLLRISTPLNLLLLFLFMFFDTLCTAGTMTIGLLFYIPWGMSLISYANAYLIAFSLNIFTQIIVAFYSDRIVTPFGRRKPFVAVSNLLRYVSFVCLANPPDYSPDALSGWFTTFYTCYMVSNAIGTNPFASWFIESTYDQVDYTQIYSIAFPIGGAIGGILGLGLLEISPKDASIATLIGGLFFTFLILFFIPAKVYRMSPHVPDMIPSIRICSQSVEFRKVFSVNVLFNGAMGIMGTTQMFLYYTTFSIKHLARVNALLLMTALIAGPGGMSFNIALNWLARFVDKIKIYLYLAVLVAILAVANFFTTFSASGLIGSVLLSSAVAMAYLPILLIAQLLLRDLVVFDTFATGLNRENMYLTAMNVPSSIFANFIGGIPTVCLSLSGFHALNNGDNDDLVSHKYTWTTFSQWIVRFFACVCVPLLTLWCFRIMSDYALTASVAERLNEENLKTAKDNDEQRRAQALEAYEHVLHASESRQALALAEEDEERSRATTLFAESEQLTDSEGQLLMHFSPTEVAFIADVTLDYSGSANSLNGSNGTETNASVAATAAANSSSALSFARGRLSVIISLVYHGVCTAMVVMVFVIAALVFDGNRLNGIFSTLLIYCFLICAFYIFFEASRCRAAWKLLQWDDAALQWKARCVCAREYSPERRNDTLDLLLARRNIVIHDHPLTAVKTVNEDIVSPIHELDPRLTAAAAAALDGNSDDTSAEVKNRSASVENKSSEVVDTRTKLQLSIDRDYGNVATILWVLGFISSVVIVLSGVN